MSIREHTGMSVDELLYDITSAELFSYWSAIIKKIEQQKKDIEETKKK